nr:hypothetical protein [Chlamydiota bacterium]
SLGGLQGIGTIGYGAIGLGVFGLGVLLADLLAYRKASAKKPGENTQPEQANQVEFILNSTKISYDFSKLVFQEGGSRDPQYFKNNLQREGSTSRPLYFQEQHGDICYNKNALPIEPHDKDMQFWMNASKTSNSEIHPNPPPFILAPTHITKKQERDFWKLVLGQKVELIFMVHDEVLQANNESPVPMLPKVSEVLNNKYVYVKHLSQNTDSTNGIFTHKVELGDRGNASLGIRTLTIYSTPNWKAAEKGEGGADITPEALLKLIKLHEQHNTTSIIQSYEGRGRAGVLFACAYVKWLIDQAAGNDKGIVLDVADIVEQIRLNERPGIIRSHHQFMKIVEFGNFYIKRLQEQN